MNIHDELRMESSRIMNLKNPTPVDYGRVQWIVDRLARSYSEPIFRKIERIKESYRTTSSSF